jgi:hypothetical protein
MTKIRRREEAKFDRAAVEGERQRRSEGPVSGLQAIRKSSFISTNLIHRFEEYPKFCKITSWMAR